MCLIENGAIFFQDEIKQYLPKIIELLNNTEPQQRVVKNVLSRILKGSPNAPAVISAQDVLTALHDLEDSVSLAKSNEGRLATFVPHIGFTALLTARLLLGAIKLCFEMPDIFKSEVVAVVLQLLVDRPKIPVLFMVTVSQSRRFV